MGIEAAFAWKIMFLVPMPPGKAINRFGLPSTNIC